jgi:acetyl esterase
MVALNEKNELGNLGVEARPDRDMREILQLLAAEKYSALSADSLPEMRAMLDGFPSLFDAPSANLQKIRDQSFRSSGSDIKVRLYEPMGWTDKAGLFLFFHGGGHVMGSLDSHDGLCRKMASAGGMAVCAVDYRLAPEHRFPNGLEDCVAAYRWVLDGVDGLGLPSQKVAVGGDSAGGNLAAAAALLIRDRGLSAPALQVLIYPGLTYTQKTQSMSEFAEGYFLTLEDIYFFRDSYLGDVSSRSDYRASPLEAEDFSGLPQAMIHTAACDPLRDHGALYAKCLSAAGVDTRVTEHPGMLHGFFSFTGRSAYAEQAVIESAEAIGRHLRNYASQDGFASDTQW